MPHSSLLSDAKGYLTTSANSLFDPYLLCAFFNRVQTSSMALRRVSGYSSGQKASAEADRTHEVNSSIESRSAAAIQLFSNSTSFKSGVLLMVSRSPFTAMAES